MSKNVNNLTTKRFVIRKSLIGKNAVITFVNKKQETVTYNHDEVYNTHADRFNSMNCFAKYKSYTNSNAVPAFCRDLQKVSEQQLIATTQCSHGAEVGSIPTLQLMFNL